MCSKYDNSFDIWMFNWFILLDWPNIVAKLILLYKISFTIKWVRRSSWWLVCLRSILRNIRYYNCNVVKREGDRGVSKFIEQLYK